MSDFTCSACGHHAGRLLLRLENHRVVRCARCELVHLLPRPLDRQNDAHQLSDLEHYDRIMSHLRAGFDAHHNRLLGLIRGWVPPPANLLEVGCASGHLLALAREAGYEVMGLEPARHNLGDMPRSLAERIMASPVESADLPAAGFDVAVAVQLIEHLLDPSILLEKLARALKPGGIAYLETPNFDCLSRRFHHKAWLGMNVGPGHWHIFNPRSLKLLSEKWEFETVRSWTFFKALSAYGRGRMARTGVAALNLSVAWLGLGNNLAVIIRRRIDRS